MRLITRATDDAAFPAEVDALADKLAHSAIIALGRMRNFLLTTFGASFERQMKAKSRAIGASDNGPEGRQGVQAFLEKRKPNWAG